MLKHNSKPTLVNDSEDEEARVNSGESSGDHKQEEQIEIDN